MHSARRSARVDRVAARRSPGARTASSSPRARDRAPRPSRARGRRRRSRPRSSGHRSRAAATAGTSAGARFSGMWRPAKTTTGSAGCGSGGVGRPAYSPSSTVDRRRARPPRAAARACSREKQNARWGTRTQASWTAQPIAPAGRAEVLAPVVARPHLVPVDDEPVAAHAGGPGRRRAARSTGTTRCGRRRSGGRGAAGATARPRRRRAAGTIRRLPRRRRGSCAGRPSRRARRRSSAVAAAIPLAQRQVRHLVAVARRGARRGCGTSARRRRPCTGTGSRRRCRSAWAPASVADSGRSLPCERRDVTFAPAYALCSAVTHQRSRPAAATPTSAPDGAARAPLASRSSSRASTRRRTSRSACRSRSRRSQRRRASHGEVVVADNDSDDGSAELAAAAGARVVHEPRRGYGSAYLAGFAAARGEYIVMADADLTYDFDEIPHFVEELDGGAELVMGDRMDNIQPGAMPWLHRYVGNPVLSGMLNLFFRTGVRDAHCGMRGLAARRPAAPRPAHDRHGVRLRDGDPRLEGEARHPRVPDRLPPARRRVEALELPRRLAPPALPARPQPDAPVHRSRARPWRRSARSSRSPSLAPDRRSSAASGTCTR